jgi:hypothetical protein
MSDTHIRSRAPEPLAAFLWSIIMVLFPAPALFSGSWWGWLLAVPCFGIATALLLSILLPGKFMHGARRVPGGFEFHAPLRPTRVVSFNAITQIDAISVRDGDTGLPFVDLIVRAGRFSVRVPEGLVRELGLLADLQSLPRFDSEAYERAVQHEPSDFMEPLGKRFRVLYAA